MAASSPRTLPILDTNSQSTTLLTPPQLPTLTESAPFKPKEHDEISLSMKRCRHGHKKRSKHVHAEPSTPCLCRGGWQTPHRPYHSKSLPSLAASTTPFLVVKSDLAQKLDDTGSTHQQRRRWTLSSKAACTRRQAATAISAVYKPTSTATPNTTGLLSPAMIVLRRASMARRSPPPKMSLTVFPEPKFERSRTWVLTSFLRTITGATNEDKEAPWPRADDRRPSLAPMGAHSAQLSRRGRVKTVCTKVTDVQPTMVSPTGIQVDGETASRRCSTKYITGDQVFEVVWDENMSSHTSTSSSEMEALSCTNSKRRYSVAMESLETQLKKADAQSRRQSQITTERRRKSSYNAECERQRQSSLHSALDFKLSRLAYEAALQNVPRSRASRDRDGKGAAGESGSGILPDTPAGDLQTEQHLCTIEFFPPLASLSRTGCTRVDPSIPVESAPMVDGGDFQYQPCPRGSSESHSRPYGRNVGASTRVRRRSRVAR